MDMTAQKGRHNWRRDSRLRNGLCLLFCSLGLSLELGHRRLVVFCLVCVRLEVLVPFAVDCVMQVAGDLRAILALVTEWLEYCTQIIVTMAELMRAVAM